MSQIDQAKKPFYGVSNYNCNNTKLFDFIETYQKTDKTILDFRKRIEDGKEECFIGLTLSLDSVGKIDCFCLLLIQDILEKDSQFLASRCQPKVYFL